MAHSETFSTDPADTPLLRAVRGHVLQRWNDQHDSRLVFHNYAQAAAVADLAAAIARAGGLSEQAMEIAQIAAWFHNMGYLYDATQPVESGAIRAEFFLAEQQCPVDVLQRVRQCITAALSDARPKTPEARVLSDAIRAYDWVETYEQRMPLLRLERELFSGMPERDADWLQFLHTQIQNGIFFTAYAKKAYEPALARRLLQCRSTMPAAAEAEPKKAKNQTVERFDRLARRPLRSSIQTYFRANYANHIRLSAIADNKAHIMISVNSILLSVAISLLTYQSLTNRNPLYILPIIMFLVTSLSSLIFAVLSSRPRVTGEVPLPGQPFNPVFFGSFVHLSPDQYEVAVDAMLRDGRLLFGNMTRDLYHLGRVLDKKYRLLTYSYTVFMMGFVATVGAFLGAYFLGE
ncbi:MAG: hypothetical protein IPH12_07110 [Saprospirales bacterium]|nr:hypothetical protein [Saprospirales bacterium]MBK8922626.1 hypothetical protein [Saprospirales bacterium]